MLGTAGGAVLVCLTLLLAIGFGVGCGLIASLILRRTWGIRAGAIDAATAAIVAVVSGYCMSEFFAARGTWTSTIGPVFFLASVSVLLRHVVSAAIAARTHPE